jgi:hypothetical protein
MPLSYWRINDRLLIANALLQMKNMEQTQGMVQIDSLTRALIEFAAQLRADVDDTLCRQMSEKGLD